MVQPVGNTMLRPALLDWASEDCPSCKEEVMIYEVIDRIPEGPNVMRYELTGNLWAKFQGLREGFEHLTLELIVVVTSAARMRCEGFCWTGCNAVPRRA